MGTTHKNIRIFTLPDNTQRDSLFEHKGSVISLDISKKQNYVISGDSKGEIIVWDLQPDFKLKIMKKLAQHSNIVNQVLFSKNSDNFLSCS